MRLLLDTHVLLWALTNPGLLSSRVTALLRNSTTTVLVSSASAWEIATKHRIGRMQGAERLIAAYGSHLTMLRAEELPISSAHALLAGVFRSSHRDPFDRMLAAQSQIEGVPLVTRDPAFDLFDDVQTIW